MNVMELGELLGNFGAFIGAIAVIATLIYVAVQVRQAKELAVDNARAARFQNDLSLLTSVVDAETYNRSWEKVVAVDGQFYKHTETLISDYGFSVPEANNMTMFCFVLFKFEEHCFLSRLTAEDQRMHDAQIVGLMAYPIFGKFWHESGTQMLDRRFVAHVDRLLQKQK